MNYREFSKDGAKVSLLGYGGMRFPQKDGKIDRVASQKLIDEAFAAGINYYDTAYMYHGGESEEFFAVALEKYPRDSYYLADKMPLWMANTPDDVDRIFEHQLKKCNTDHFDFYLVHAIDKGVLKKLRELGAYEKLMKRKQAGQIRRLGFSFHDSVAVLNETLDSYEWDFVQIQLNYFDWTYQDAEGQYDAIVAHGLPCIVMEPVRGGALVSVTPEADQMLTSLHPDWSVASWAMRFAASRPDVLCVLSGMTQENALIDNINAVNTVDLFNESEEKAAFEAADMLLKAKTVPCTGCNYCAFCPQTVAIPKIFRAYNDARLSGWTGGFKDLYSSLKPDEHPDNCISCGTCADRCPQHIDIPEVLKQIRSFAKDLGV